MRNNLTELVFILDRSGSMGGLESDTIGGYNSLIEKQKKEDGEVNLSTILFDDRYELLHDRANIKDVDLLTNKEYIVGGSTALLDAIGITINQIGQKLSETKESKRPGKVLFIITTDGEENSSKEYSVEKVRKMIEHQTQKYNWEFLFLGANIDAISVACNIGIREQCAGQYCCDSFGIKSCYDEMSSAISSFRINKKIKNNWKEKIESDYAKREKK